MPLYTFTPEEVEILLLACRLIIPFPFTVPDPGSKIKPPLPDLVISAFKIISFEATKVKSFELLDDIEL